MAWSARLSVTGLLGGPSPVLVAAAVESARVDDTA